MARKFWTTARAASIIPFKFEFAATGNFSAWTVEYLGVDQANGQRTGEFDSSINSGFILRVIIKVWDGDYSITYSCQGPAGTARTGTPTSPITGSTTTTAPKTITIDIQF